MVTTKQKPIVNMQKIKRKEYKSSNQRKRAREERNRQEVQKWPENN